MWLLRCRPRLKMANHATIEFMGGPWDGLVVLTPDPKKFMLLPVEPEDVSKPHLRNALYSARGTYTDFMRYDFVETRPVKARRQSSP